VGDRVCIEASEAEGRFVLLCEHASSHIPQRLGTLGLTQEARHTHVAWDIGALTVAQRLSALLDSPLIYPAASRLVIDCNRALDHPNLIVSETVYGPVPGNLDMAADERERRIVEVHCPFHQSIHDILLMRLASGVRTSLISIHSFTPIFRGRARPWHFGLIHGCDARLALRLHAELASTSGREVGLNEPYAPADGVLHSLARHGEANDLPCVMIEIRDDLIRTSFGQESVALILAEALASIEDASNSRSPVPTSAEVR
jgi:predicted N-formylglutamate amidohydrolase